MRRLVRTVFKRPSKQVALVKDPSKRVALVKDPSKRVAVVKRPIKQVALVKDPSKRVTVVKGPSIRLSVAQVPRRRFALVLMFMLTACSRQSTSTTAPTANDPASKEAPHRIAPTADDSASSAVLQRRMTPANDSAPSAVPQRIVTLSPNADDVLCEIGAAGQIVGVSRFTMPRAELADRPRIGGLFDPDIERILALRPDLIVVRGHNEEIERLCAARGIRLYLDPTEDIATLDRFARDLGAMLKVEDRAGELLARFHGRLDAAERLARSRRGGGRRPRVLLTMGRSPGALRDVMTSAKGTLHDDLLRIAGGDNLFGDLDIKFPTVSLEQIVVGAPEVVIELMPERHVTDELRGQVRAEWASIGPLPAVKADRIIVFGDEMPNSLIPSPRIVDLVEKLVDILYPPAAP